jgi:hypothetical protein
MKSGKCHTGPLTNIRASFGACCASVASLAWSLAAAGMPGVAGGGGPGAGRRQRDRWRVLVLDGRGSGAVTGVASHLDAGHAGGSTTGTCQWSRTAWSRGRWRQRWSSHRDQVLPGAARRWRRPGAPGGLGTWLSCVSWPHRIPTSPGRGGGSPQNPHGRNGIPRYTAARMLTWPLLALTSLYAGSAGLTIVKLPVVRSGTDLLKSGRSAVRPCP